MAAAVAYLGRAAGQVYGERGLIRLVKVVLLGLEAGVAVIGYRFLVFLITLYTTGVH